MENASAAPAECRLPIRVRYVECDPMGYAHHSHYAAWLEMGRTELLRQSGWRYRDLEERGFFFVVAKLEIRFKLPARYDDEMELVTAVTRMTRARIEHGYKLLKDGVILTEAATTLACVNRQGELIPIPDEILQGK